MADKIRYSVVEGVALINVDNPPNNTLSHAVRVALMEAMDRAEEDDAVAQIVLSGAGATFPAGSDISEYEKPLQEPHLRDLCERVECAEKPVIAALHGLVYGGGLELALAAHYRIAAHTTRFSLSEIRLGLPPSAGGSQRLPRLVGAKLALEMAIGVMVLSASDISAQALIDGTTDGPVDQAALRFCRQLADAGKGPRRVSEMRKGFADPVAYQAEVEAWRKKLPKQDEWVAGRIVSLIEAAPLLPFEAGLAMEEAAFEDSLSSAMSKALRHVFLAERLARNFEMSERIARPQMRRIAVLGGGTLAVQIVLSALNAGIGVNWGTRDTERLREGAAQVRKLVLQGVKSGSLTEAAAEARLALLQSGDSADMVAGSDLIIHAARGQGDVAAPDTLVRAVAMASRVDELGLRFAPPVFSTRLVEIVQGPQGRPDQLAVALALADRMGKVPVHVRSTGESIAGRLAAILNRAADALVDVGVSPYAVDAAVLGWGWPRAPFQANDLFGLDGLAQAPRAEGAQNWAAQLLAEGRTGRVEARGFYDWSSEKPLPDPKVTKLLEAHRPTRDMPAELILQLLCGAMANEGLRMLQSGMARKSSDIDVVSILAQELPRWRGGVMKAVSLLGLFSTMKAMERLGHGDSAIWTAEPMWGELVKHGRSFDGLKAAT